MYLILGGIGLFIFILFIKGFSQQSQDSSSATTQMTFLKFDSDMSLDANKKELVGAYVYNKDSAGMFTGENAKGKKFIKEETFPQPYRIIKPNFMYTMDYNDKRLNVHVDDNFMIKDLKWG
jgi:Peptidase inhibitor I78 family